MGRGNLVNYTDKELIDELRSRKRLLTLGACSAVDLRYVATGYPIEAQIQGLFERLAVKLSNLYPLGEGLPTTAITERTADGYYPAERLAHIELTYLCEAGMAPKSN